MEKDIARIAEVAKLSPLQVAFLSSACARMRAMPAPDEREFVCYMRELLCSSPYPAMLLDGLFYVRAWNSYVDLLARGTSRAFGEEIHPIAMMLRADPAVLAAPEEHHRSLRDGLRIFWINTAVHSHRPEYASMLQELQNEPRFRELWMALAFCSDEEAEGPISFAYSLAGSGAQLRTYSRTIVFPPIYYLTEYQPDDDRSRERLRRLQEQGPPQAYFKRELHWAKQPPDACV